MDIYRKILLPFSAVYGAVVTARNYSYDIGLLKSTSFPIPLICVGNLSVGGTGKSPMIEYLLQFLLPEIKTATLSRGYGRKTSGFILLTGRETAAMTGDEPLQFKSKYPDAIVAVDENRRRGISTLLATKHPRVILLDDAFQHRRVKAGLNILLTSCEKIYADDLLLPAGNLRESSSGAGRADIVVVSKCPPDLSVDKRIKIAEKLNIKEHQQLYFTFISYAQELEGRNKKLPLEKLEEEPFTLVTGIAKPAPLLDYLEKLNLKFRHLDFPDHYNFTAKDIKKLQQEKVILTTEKDYMRLKDVINHPHLYYIPIKMKFLSNEEDFQNKVKEYIA